MQLNPSALSHADNYTLLTDPALRLPLTKHTGTCASAATPEL
jgi:hypothetical protein